MAQIPTNKKRPGSTSSVSRLSLSGTGRSSTRQSLRSSSGSSGMGWITILAVGILLVIIIGVVYNSSSTPASIASQTANTSPIQQQPKPAERQRTTPPPTQPQTSPIAEQTATPEPETDSTEEAQPDIAQQESSDNEETESEDAVAAAEEEEGPAKEEAEEKGLVLGAKVNNTAAQADVLDKLVRDAIESADYTTLRNTLAEALKSSYPHIFEEKNTSAGRKTKKGTDNTTAENSPETPQSALAHLDPKKLRVKNKLGQRALAICYCLDLMLETKAQPDQEKQFMTFLLAVKKKNCPAEVFLSGITRRRVEKEFALEMMQELCDFYRDEPEKAFREISAITATRADKINNRYYPASKKDIEKTIEKILITKPSNGANVAQQEAINLANVYRYICGVNPSLKYDREFGAQAEDAAAACQRAGKIDHGLGHSTGVCNLHSGMDARVKSVPGYIMDPGDPNRKARGHRNWILDPAAAKTAFGQAGIYHAMRVMDFSSGWTPPGGYSYPGRGYFPVRYMHGDGWSYYAPPGKSMGEEPKVEMWRLSRAPRNLVSQRVLTKTRQIPIKEVFPNGRYIVFEPDYDAPAMRKTDTGAIDGVYWIRVTGDGFKDEYLVEFY